MKRILLALLVATVMFWETGCEKNPSDPTDKSENPPVTTGEYEVFAPAKVPSGMKVPVVIRAVGVNSRSYGWQDIQLAWDIENNHPSECTIKRGMGSFEYEFAGDNVSETLRLVSGSVQQTVYASRVIRYWETPEMRQFESCELVGEGLRWDSTAVIRVAGVVTVPAGVVLAVLPGTIVLLEANATLAVEGSISAMGSKDAPILFTGQNDAWGEVNVSGGELRCKWVFFTHGGGDESRAFGHSDSQPVIRTENGTTILEHCFILDNPGKAMASSRGIVSMDSCLISRCDTGGEHLESFVTVDNSFILDIPVASSEEEDDDNDGIYLNGYNEGIGGPHVIRNTVICTGKDDAIDHNGAMLCVENCILEDVPNEGVACSNRNVVTIDNTLILNCEQGIEAGYGAPEIHVDHCFIMNCDYGLRWGDWYAGWEHNGVLMVSNTVSCASQKSNVYNYDPQNELPRQGAITISHSIVNHREYNDINNNLVGEVQYDEYYLLKEGTPGYEMGNDGKSIGLYQ